MSVISLVSGGLDSTLMAAICAEEGIPQHPLFIDYGQRAADRELAACRASLERLSIPGLLAVKVDGYRDVAPSGLNDPKRDVVIDAFTPCRNLLFVTLGAAYAGSIGAEAVAIGLLHERTALFPDQTERFLASAEATCSVALGRSVRVLAPLSEFSKADVVALAQRRGIAATYSCHLGGPQPCGRCIACREFPS